MSEKFRQAVNKKVGKNIIAKGNEILQLPRIPTGSLSLDVETGGGIPIGRISSLVGEWSSGKTAVTLKIAGNYQSIWPHKEIYWIDAEGVFDPKWARVLGLDPDKVFVVRPEYAEQAYNIALGAIEDDAGLVVIDSVAALSSKAETEADMDQVLVAPMARVNSKFLRKMGTSFSSEDEIPPTLIYLNQMRQNIAPYGPPMLEPGGEALSFYPSLKIILRKGELYDGNKIYKSISANDEGVEVKAQAIKFYTEKNKTAPFKRRGHFWFYFDGLDSFRSKGSYDRLDEIIRYTKKYSVVHQRGKYYDLVNPKTGEVRTFVGMNEVATYIRSDRNVQQWVEDLITEAVLKDMTDEAPAEEEVEVLEKQVDRKLRVVDDSEGEESSEAV